MKTVQFIIDPQKDFINAPNFTGSLAVEGAYEDMLKIADHIKETMPEAIIITLDTHERLDIAHNQWWVDNEGNHPSPYTVISVQDVINGKWKSLDEKQQEYSLYYVQELEKNKKYELRIWPDHCIFGTEGHKVNDELNEVLKEWEKTTGKKVFYVNKGTNPKTEHYSGLKAEVVLDNAQETKLNIELINKLNEFDKIEISGEALSHCVGSTLIDLLENLPSEDRKKVNILTNATSPVSGFEIQANEFLEKAVLLGATLQNTKQVKKLNI